MQLEAITPESIEKAVTYIVAMLLSLSFHEAAHALVATLRGDTTAKDLGRLSLNPLVHIDPIGTVLLPMIGALANLPIIGWAKPVPVDLSRTKNPRLDNLLVSLAGPFSNLLLCLMCVAAVLAHHSTGFPAPESPIFPFVALLNAMIWVNAFLAFFNLLPIPPLDGAALATTLMPVRWANKYEEFIAPYGYFLLLMIIISGGLHWLPGIAQAFVEGGISLMAPLFGASST